MKAVSRATLPVLSLRKIRKTLLHKVEKYCIVANKGA
jgi:hypothetical protein